MAWGNLEVESVELVQDMSYEKLKERLYRALQKGNNEAKEELCRNFDIAVRAVEKKWSNINECIMQCDESFRILLSNLFLTLDIVKVKLGFTVLEHKLLNEIRKECNKDIIERNLQKMAGTCNKELEEDIEEIELYGKPDDAEILTMLLKNREGKSVFENFVDSVNHIVICAEDILKKYYDKSSDGQFENVVVRAIYLYVDREWNEYYSSKGKTLEGAINRTACRALDLYNSKYNMQIMTIPFTYALNTIVKQ